MTVAAVLLAGGSGSRFQASDPTGSHKLLAEFRGRRLVEWSLEAVAGAGFNQFYVVSGAVDLTEVVRSTLGDGPTMLSNPDWATGQASSLALAIDAATVDGHRAIVVGLADQPLVPTSAWRAVGASAGKIVTATFDGKRRPPVKLEGSVWADVPRSGDEGARSLMQLRPELVSELPCSGNPVDIDTVEDLRRWS